MDPAKFQTRVNFGFLIAILILFALVAEQASRLSTLTQAVSNCAEFKVEPYRVME